jgi:hypothetical protein
LVLVQAIAQADKESAEIMISHEIDR